MATWQRWFFWLSTAGTTVTGSAIIIMKYFLKPMGGFSIVNHTLQPLMLKLHILFAALMLFGLGTLLINHIIPYFFKGKQKKGRKTGFVNLMLVPVMVLSGYLIQMITPLHLLKIIEYTHIYSSIAFVVVFVMHQYRTAPERKVGVTIALLLLAGLTWVLCL